MHAGDGDDRQNEQRYREEARGQAERQCDAAKQIESGHHLPADLGWHDAERDGKAILDVHEPVVAVEYFQAGLEEIQDEQQAQAEQTQLLAEQVEVVE